MASAVVKVATNPKAGPGLALGKTAKVGAEKAKKTAKVGGGKAAAAGIKLGGAAAPGSMMAANMMQPAEMAADMPAEMEMVPEMS